MDANPQMRSQLVDLERQFWQAMKDKDAPAANRLTLFPTVVAGAQGIARIGDGANMAGMLSSPSWSIEDFEIGQTEFMQVSDDVAVLAYKVREDLKVEGENVTLEAADTSTWVRQDGQWKCAVHTESIAGDPYGRDRRAVAG